MEEIINPISQLQVTEPSSSATATAEPSVTPNATNADTPAGNGETPATVADGETAGSSKDADMKAKPSIAKKARRKRNKKKNSKNGPNFSNMSSQALQRLNRDRRKIPVPPHRMTPLRSNWMQIYEPIVRHLKLQIRMNLATKTVELKTGKETGDPGALQKGQDFIKAFILGFAIPDAIALVRLDDLYIETFEVKDIRSTLKGDHLARAVGRIAGKDGRTKFTIENATKTRIVVADTKIHILGSYENTRLARHSISSLVLGTAPGKIYNKLRTVSARLNEKKF